MSVRGTLLPSAEAASCPQLAEGDIRALAEKSGFDVVDGCAGRPAEGRRCKSVTVKA